MYDEQEIRNELSQAGYNESQISKIHYKAYEDGHYAGAENVLNEFHSLANFMIEVKEAGA